MDAVLLRMAGLDVPAIDFFSVSLSVTHLQDQFNKFTHDIMTAIIPTLLFRPLGAIAIAGSGPSFVTSLVAVLELGAGFVQNFKQFLALQSLFGVGMGGIWGLPASTALENLLVELRGVGGGFLLGLRGWIHHPCCDQSR
ncbi:uncharacterized protein LACBIDRAFT_303045 [Laccaria bicolor S238N-H82]|uniref:Predicted protein n=1 Tax=Laccaria bicolor (strain S238N-H82 / ATCC MYA-4686) TaxID=486041 RepID=B0DIU2_LACBS|nr:uncharacterized protein LACBIDRAFT_303045 [Laccaria bicolor S238N-H82]EDR05293.1 predicted protein [Laccaria bicolor S238N-H82]|eukprot:XP_001883851.1 predicted protein [Laccaria bicolor S238N-H82]